MDDQSVSRDSSPSPATFFNPRYPVPRGPNHVVLPPIRSIQSTRPTEDIQQLMGLGHIATLRDVESAFHQADIALQQAREALRNDAIMSGRHALPPATIHTGRHNGNNRNGNGNGNTSDVVDLTTLSSDTSNEDPEVQWSATRHPNDPQPRGRINGPAGYTGMGIASTLASIRPYNPYAPPHAPNQRARADESAINRQRQARRDWERVERRNRERAAEQARRDALEDSRRAAGIAMVLTNPEIFNTDGTPRARRDSSDSSSSSISILSNDSINSEHTNTTTNQNTQNTSHPSESTTTTMPPTQSSGPTTFEFQPNFKEKILAQQQQSAIAAQNSSSKNPQSAKPHATPLSTYRCAICMDTPTAATTTICGHVFCHTCLKDSLKWSGQQRREDAGLHGRRLPPQGTGLCPVCRKVLSDKEGGPKSNIVGLEIRKMSRKEWEKKKKQEKIDEEREEFLRSLEPKIAELEKGKEKEKEPNMKTEYVSEEGEDYGSLRERRGRLPGREGEMRWGSILETMSLSIFRHTLDTWAGLLGVALFLMTLASVDGYLARE